MIAVIGCKGCMKCDEVCKYNTIIRNGNKVVRIDEDKCKKCYECIKACPYGALFVLD